MINFGGLDIIFDSNFEKVKNYVKKLNIYVFDRKVGS